MFCSKCGMEMTSDGRFCEVCGAPDDIAAPPAIPATAATASESALTWFLAKPAWQSSLWMPLLWFVNPFGVPLGEVLAAGWMVEATRSNLSGGALPTQKEIAPVVESGVAATVAYWAFLKIPMMLLASWFEWDTSSFRTGVASMLINQFFNFQSVQGFFSSVMSFSISKICLYLAATVLPMVYTFCVLFLLLTAMARYAALKRFRTWFDLPANLAIALKNTGPLVGLIVTLFLVSIGVSYLISWFGDGWIPQIIFGGLGRVMFVCYLTRFARRALAGQSIRA